MNIFPCSPTIHQQTTQLESIPDFLSQQENKPKQNNKQVPFYVIKLYDYTSVTCTVPIYIWVGENNKPDVTNHCPNLNPAVHLSQ